MNTDVQGYRIPFDFSKLIKVSDLISFDGPLLSHYMSDKGENYLFYWVEVDGYYNRWIVIRVDIFTIQKYLDKKITLHSIITNPNDGFVYIVDIDSDLKFHNNQLVLISDLPEIYTPTEDSYYNSEIIDDIDLVAISQKYSSGILEFHISGRDVKYGSIPLYKFAPIIPKIEDMRKTMSARYIRRIKHGLNNDLGNDAKRNIDRELRLDTQYEYIYSLAGSVRIILKPINQQVSFVSTYSDDFAHDIVSLLASGYNKDDISRFAELYDKNVLKKYNDLIVYLNEENLSLGVKWCNKNASKSFGKSISVGDSKIILSNLSDFEFDRSEDIELMGRFYSLNVKTGSYSFESSEGDDFKSAGYLDEDRRQMAFDISFSKIYKVTIHRKTSEAVGGKEQIKDTIISFIEQD